MKVTALNGLLVKNDESLHASRDLCGTFCDQQNGNMLLPIYAEVS